MEARVFISRRSSDGADKAAALAHDLEALFGDGQIDVEASGAPLPPEPAADGSTPPRLTPMLLVLVTPEYLGATDHEGRRCIDREDDVPRRELEAALLGGARVLPLLGDGVVAMPAAAELPPPFDRLPSLPWRRLSTDDWRSDIARIADDLRHLGLVPRAEPTEGTMPLSLPVEGPITTPMGLAEEPGSLEGGADPDGRRKLLGLVALGAVLAGGYALWRRRPPRAAELGGRWNARIGVRGSNSADDGDAMVVTLVQKGRSLTLSGTLDVAELQPWAEQRARWKARTGDALTTVLYRGEGSVLDLAPRGATTAGSQAASAAPAASALADPSAAAARLGASDGGQPGSVADAGTRRIELAVTIVGPDTPPTVVDRGTLRATLDAGARSIQGRLWLESEAADRVIQLRRGE